MTRTTVAVLGAGDLATAVAAAAAGGTRLESARAALAAGGRRLDLDEAAAASRAEGRGVVVHETAGGAVVAVRWFEPGRPTAIHGHGTWGVALQVEGASRYERWERQPDGSARVADVRLCRPGDTVAWGPPPDDVHRQEGAATGGLELLVLGAHPVDGDALDPSPSVLARAAERLVAGGTVGDLYRDDALLDANVPTWRYQLAGAATIELALREHAASMPDLRVTRARVDHGDSHVAVEIECRAASGADELLWREVHLVRAGGGGVADHSLYCTGVWDAATIARQQREAPMVRW